MTVYKRIVARNPIKNWLRSSKLNVSCETAEPYCQRIQVRRAEGTPPETEGYSLRIRITNRSRYLSFHQVAVTASKIFREGDDGGFHTVAGFEPVELTWSESFGLFQDFSPGSEHFCFVGRLMKPNRTTEFLGGRHPDGDGRYTYLNLAAEARHSGEPHIVPPGRYRLYFTLSGPDTPPHACAIRLFLSGDWHDDDEQMRAEGFGMETADPTENPEEPPESGSSKTS